MKIKNIGHPSYRVSDRDKALAFYCGALGLKKKFTISYEEWMEHMGAKEGDPLYQAMKPYFGQIWITYLEVAPHQYIELFYPEGATEHFNWALDQFNHIGYLHLALEVEDIHAAYEELKAKPNVKIINEPNLGVEHAWQFWIEDPDGNSIELMQYEDDAWQLTGHEEAR